MGPQDDGIGRREGRAGHLVAGFALALLGAAAGLIADASPSVPSATDIYDRTRATVAARAIPAFIAYTQDVALMRHGKTRAERSRIIVRMADGRTNVERVPAGSGDRVDPTPMVTARPLVYPTTSFGLVPRRTGEAASSYEAPASASPAPDAHGPAVIGRVRSVARDYDPTLVGVESLDGYSVYHLRLAPRFDPQHHPIRELFVDTRSYDPRRIDIEVWGSAGPIRSRPTVVVDFAPVNGTWVIAHAALDFVLRFAFFNYGGSGDFRTSDVRFPTTEPDWLFDPALLRAHEVGARAGSQ